jgi:Prenyltransferase and squalene oxidase repeat
MSANATRTGLASRMANLLDLGARAAGVPSVVAAQIGAALSHAEPVQGQRLGGYSELNSDGTPIQLCLTASPGGRRAVRIIADPAWRLSDPATRLAESSAALARALPMADAASLAPICATLLTHAVPADPDAIRAFPSAFFWLGAGLGRPGFAIYADLRPHPTQDSWADPWALPRRWLTTVLPQAEPAIAVLHALGGHAQPASLGLEGTGRDRGRAKIYWRLKRPAALTDLGIALLLDPRLAAFLASIIGDREMNLSGMVMSASFDLATGAIADVKIDLCAHCLPRSDDEWIAALDGIARRLDLALPIDAAELGADRAALSFAGLGIDQGGAARLNIYLKPASGAVRPDDAMADAADYLCALQTADGSFQDYDLPVGAATEWVTGFAGLALACASRAGAFPAAREAACRAARWLRAARSYPAGWGYNGRTGADADTTGFALRLLRATGHDIADDDEQCLLGFWRPEGGFATYNVPDHWGDVHCCVTAAAFLALSSAHQRALLPALRAYLRRTRRPDGSWPAYWWRTHHYSTWHHLRLLRWLGIAPAYPPPRMPPPDDDASAFELVYALGIAATHSGARATAGELLQRLLWQQRADGAWPGGFELRVTEPDCAEPWRAPRGRLYRDRCASVTTASALMVLSDLMP